MSEEEKIALSEKKKRALSEKNKTALSEKNKTALNESKRNAIEAEVFRRLVAHLDNRKDVQNIDLMNLAGFCRNCLSKWYTAAAKEQGVEIDYEQSREFIYGMPYPEWKEKHQTPATPEQLARMQQQQEQ